LKGGNKIFDLVDQGSINKYLGLLIWDIDLLPLRWVNHYLFVEFLSSSHWMRIK
jgi:hypothetical protein